ncbi:MAG: hypothetical protein ABI113_08295 [Mucilaginibacter sp.]
MAGETLPLAFYCSGQCVSICSSQLCVGLVGQRMIAVGDLAGLSDENKYDLSEVNIVNRNELLKTRFDCSKPDLLPEYYSPYVNKCWNKTRHVHQEFSSSNDWVYCGEPILMNK